LLVSTVILWENTAITRYPLGAHLTEARRIHLPNDAKQQK